MYGQITMYCDRKSVTEATTYVAQLFAEQRCATKDIKLPTARLTSYLGCSISQDRLFEN